MQKPGLAALTTATALLLALAGALPGCGGGGGPAPTRAVYIYETDFDTAYGFKALVEDAGGSCDLLPMTEVQTADFSPYNVILIGHDTGDVTGWGGSGDAAAVEAANKPVLGIGRGGSYLFEDLGLNIGWMSCWTTDTDAIEVVDAALPVYNTPNDMSVVTDLTVSVHYALVSNSVAVYVPTPGTVEVLCRQEGTTDHYLVAREDRFVLWGFNGSPATLTPAGADLFENVLEYIRSF